MIPYQLTDAAWEATGDHPADHIRNVVARYVAAAEALLEDGAGVDIGIEYDDALVELCDTFDVEPPGPQS